MPVSAGLRRRTVACNLLQSSASASWSCLVTGKGWNWLAPRPCSVPVALWACYGPASLLCCSNSMTGRTHRQYIGIQVLHVAWCLHPPCDWSSQTATQTLDRLLYVHKVQQPSAAAAYSMTNESSVASVMSARVQLTRSSRLTQACLLGRNRQSAHRVS